MLLLKIFRFSFHFSPLTTINPCTKPSKCSSGMSDEDIQSETTNTIYSETLTEDTSTIQYSIIDNLNNGNH